MKTLPIWVFGFVLSIALTMFLPKFALQIIGCYQIGSWIGSFIQKKIDQYYEDQFFFKNLIFIKKKIMKKIITLTESDLIRLVKKIISESDDKPKLYYRKCEGGYGLIEPESFEYFGRDKYIKFLRKPNPDFDNGNSKSINKCLSFEQEMTGLCYNTKITSDIYKIAFSEIDCKTRKPI